MSQDNKGGEVPFDSFKNKNNAGSQQTQQKSNTQNNGYNNNNSNNRSGYNNQNSNNSSNSYNRQLPTNSKIKVIMKGIKEKGYCESGSNVLRKELLDNEANQIVMELSEVSGRNKELTTTQLRSFFAEVKKLSFKYEGNKKNEEINRKMIVDLLILKSKVEYKKDKISEDFRDFMKENIDIVISEGTVESYNNFVIFFEVIVGLLYGKGKVKNN